MKKILVALPLAALVAVSLVACEEGPTAVGPESGTVTNVMLVNGVLMPVAAPPPPSRSNFDSDQPTSFDPDANLIGSDSNPVSLTPSSCETGSSASITVRFHVSGNQLGTATFKVKPTWTYTVVEDQGVWTGSGETTVQVPPQSGGTTTTWPVTLTTINDSEAASGPAVSFGVTTYDLTNTNATGAKLDGEATATVWVQFIACEDDDAGPTLNLPEYVSDEADTRVEGVAGAYVDFSAMVSAEDGEGTSVDVTCAPASGSFFPIGATTVSCSAGTSSGTFPVYVVDTTAPVFTSFPGDQTVTATDQDGWVVDLSGFNIQARDLAPNADPTDASLPEISGVAGIECKIGGEDAAGQTVALGDRVQVSCTATDNAAYWPEGWDDDPTPNVSAARNFYITVGLDLACGFGQPLRMEAPFSAHKRNSTVPHKLCAPTYADGSEATDIAHLLGLHLTWTPSSGTQAEVETISDPAAGSTAWRWDSTDNQYIFNAKTANNWSLGKWTTRVMIGAFELLSTEFELRR